MLEFAESDNWLTCGFPSTTVTSAPFTEQSSAASSTTADATSLTLMGRLRTVEVKLKFQLRTKTSSKCRTN